MKKLSFIMIAMLIAVFGIAPASFALPNEVNGTVSLDIVGVNEFNLSSFMYSVPAGGGDPVTDYIDTLGNLDFGAIDATDPNAYPDPDLNPYLPGTLYLAAPNYYEIRYAMNNNIDPYKVTILFDDQGDPQGLFANVLAPQGGAIMHFKVYDAELFRDPNNPSDTYDTRFPANFVPAEDTAVGVTPGVEQDLYNCGGTAVADNFVMILSLDHVSPFNPSGTFNSTVTYTMKSNL